MEKDQRRISNERLRLYLIIVIIAVGAAVFSSMIIRSSGGLKACTSIVVQQYRDSCLNQLALSTDNASICNHLQQNDSIYSCYSSVAEKYTDAGVCEMIHMNSIEYPCIENISSATGNYKLCAQLDQSNASMCYSGIAAESFNESICSHISNTLQQNVCISAVSFKKVFAFGNGNSCSSVASMNISDMLNALSDAKLTSDPTLQTDIESLLSYQSYSNNGSISGNDFCYTLFSIRYQNTSYCGNISNQKLGLVCRQQGSPLNSSVNYTALLNSCANLQGSQGQECTDSVMLYEAIHTKNASICNNFSIPARYQCFTSLAEAYHNVTYCGYISNATVNGYCSEAVGYNISQG